MAKNPYPPRYTLPTNPDDLVEATNMLEDAGRRYRRPQRVGWRYDLWWLRGVRKFRIMWSAGEVAVNWQNERGELQLRFEDVLVKRQREGGRLRQIDIRPSVRSKGVGLDALRKASIAQVVLDHLTTNVELERFKGQVVDCLLDFGMCGVGTWVESSVHLGQTQTIEMIHPWELLPIPTDPCDDSERFGIIRDRYVPLDWVMQREGLTLPRGKEGEEKMQIRQLGPGARLPGDSDPSSMLLGGYTANLLYQPSNKQNNADMNSSKLYTKWVYLREYWIEGERGRVARYIVKVGDHIALDKFFPGEGETEAPMMPVQIARYYDIGFFGRSFISPLIPINRKQEKMVSNLFQNIEDLDIYGIRLIPLDWNISRDTMKNLGRLRYAYFKPEISSQGRIKMETLLPQNLGEMPGKIVAMASEMIDRLSRESDIWSGKAEGRADSGSTYRLLYETASIPMIPVTASLANAMVGVYGAMLQVASKLLSGSAGQSIKLLTLDDAIAGVVLDPGTGEMKLDANNVIPSPGDVVIDVQERLPRLETKALQDLENQFASGKIDLVDYIIECMRRNIDVPVGNRGIRENVRTAWLENIMLFGDGTTPGTIIQNPDYDNHKIHLRILEDFMARPEWRLASDAVRQKFLIHKAWHRAQLGEWPEGVPNPEALAAFPEQLQASLGQAAQMPG